MAKGLTLKLEDGRTLRIGTFSQLRDGARFIKLFEEPVRGHQDMFTFSTPESIWQKDEKWAMRAGSEVYHRISSSALVIEVVQ